MSIKSYITIARPSHWFKNVAVLPGTVIAALFTNTPVSELAWPLLIGLISICLIASANYVINEWLDAKFDHFHPVKKNRPSVVGDVKAPLVYIEYVILSVAGPGLAMLISTHFFSTAIAFLIMGILYNVEPLRTKDRVYLDVLSESANNPIRLLLGWFIVTNQCMPPSSLILGYWMGGAFLMAIKRYAELQVIADPHASKLYRRTFGYYTKESLLVSAFFYGECSAFFLGVFLIKYRIELLFSLPFFAFLFSLYLHIGLKPNSIAQNPERLYREKFFILYVVILTIVVSVLLFLDLPWLNWFLQNSFISK
jgi:4-hydroxybenzoate polyprenyltransferase